MASATNEVLQIEMRTIASSGGVLPFMSRGRDRAWDECPMRGIFHGATPSWVMRIKALRTHISAKTALHRAFAVRTQFVHFIAAGSVGATPPIIIAVMPVP